MVVQFGGQTAIKLTKFLKDMDVRILGTSADAIDEAEDRGAVRRTVGTLRYSAPGGETRIHHGRRLEAADRIGYPVLLRPSYVLGGQNMIIAYGERDVGIYMAIITSHELENPVLIDKYMMGIEAEVDAIVTGRII